ncbi:hypothetical protein DPMN_085658 [Dreissena polymorpha]|uniref:Uncharacterized protein n=1 Tax=Dreissena polymorpha TaxID=45954 RepID=A0A9D4BKH2_DREPO|nr:hypothetical protein DPMN_085658 [Dreissena polymorpha]
MNEPQQVESDGEIYLRYRPRSRCERERSETTGNGSRKGFADMMESSGFVEAESAGSSTRAAELAFGTNFTDDGSLKQTSADMAVILKDVLSELKEF